jgi:hypothetical protein
MTIRALEIVTAELKSVSTRAIEWHVLVLGSNKRGNIATVMDARGLAIDAQSREKSVRISVSSTCPRLLFRGAVSGILPAGWLYAVPAGRGLGN